MDIASVDCPEAKLKAGKRSPSTNSGIGDRRRRRDKNEERYRYIF
jgi:hypothetical protein